MMSRLHICLW